MELRAIRAHLDALPPPPAAGTSIREWFVGIALSNPELMAGVPPEERVAEAVRLADDLVRALNAPRVPSRESMSAPTEPEMRAWDGRVAEQLAAKAAEAEKKVPQDRPTQPAVPAARHPTPAQQAAVHFRRASDHLWKGRADLSPPTPTRAIVAGAGRYSSVEPDEE